MFGVVVFTLALLGNRTTEPYKGHHLVYFRATFSAIFTISIIQIAGAALVHVLYTNFLFEEFWFFFLPYKFDSRCSYEDLLNIPFSSYLHNFKGSASALFACNQR